MQAENSARNSLFTTMSFLRPFIFAYRGYFYFTETGYELAEKRFVPSDTDVDLKHEFIMITGANSGIGKAAAMELAKKGATIYLVCRNRKRGEEAVEEIKNESQNNNIHLFISDLSSPQQSLKFTYDFIKSERPLTTFCANAGCMVNDFELIDEKYDANFATNTLSPYIFIRELMPVLQKAEQPKIFITSSGGMYTAKLDPDCQKIQKIKNYKGIDVYAQNKRQQVEIAEYFAKKHPEIFIASWHPGWVDTPAVRTSMPGFYERMKNKLRPVEHGADTLVWLACQKSPLEKFKNGEFFGDREVLSKHFPLAFTTSSESDVKTFIDKLEEFYTSEKKIFDG